MWDWNRGFHQKESGRREPTFLCMPRTWLLAIFNDQSSRQSLIVSSKDIRRLFWRLTFSRARQCSNERHSVLVHARGGKMIAGYYSGRRAMPVHLPIPKSLRWRNARSLKGVFTILARNDESLILMFASRSLNRSFLRDRFLVVNPMPC